MMKSDSRLVRFCEEWWSRLAQSDASLLDPASVGFLELLGWSDTKRGDFAEGAMRVCMVGTRPALTFAFVGPGALDAPSNVVDAGLDYCAGTRRAAGAARHTEAPYLCVTDFYRTYLYDLRSDELLLYSDSPERFRMEMYVEVMREAVEEDSLDELRRDPKSYTARQLRAWCSRWGAAAAKHPSGNEGAGEDLIDRLLALGFLVHHGPRPAEGDAAMDALQAFSSGRIAADGAGGAFYRLMSRLGDTFNATLLSPEGAIGRLFEDAQFGDTLAREFTLLSRTKFTIPVILESFNYGDAQEKMRVRIVPEYDETRDQYLSTQTASSVDALRVEVDLVDEGYRAVGHWFEKVIRTYERIAIESGASTDAVAGREDLMNWSERNASTPDAARDPYRWCVEQGLRILHAAPRQLRLARLMLYLHLMQRMALRREPLRRFPNMEAAFAARPRLVASEKRFMYGRSNADAMQGRDAMG